MCNQYNLSFFLLFPYIFYQFVIYSSVVQIILVTHNPNIVVGADSEEVIVANQNGKNAPNDKGIKFQYVYGSLEHSMHRNSDESLPILCRCGIREHVCDILEGGENAFRDRENKYGFFKI